MTTSTRIFGSPAILSIRVCSIPPLQVYVVTPSPSLVSAVRELLQQSHSKVSVVWLTSIASACHRLACGGAATVVLHDTGQVMASNDALSALKAAAPGTRVMVL